MNEKKWKQITIAGDDHVGGSYVLLISVAKTLRVRFGKSKSSKRITVPPGLYTYVGSARSSLHTRLLRHASRHSGKPHKIRNQIQWCFIEMRKGEKVTPLDTKKRRWQVDDLLQQPAAELVGVCGFQHAKHIKIEAELGKQLELDPATSILVKGIGASDIPGNTHLLRVDADELWWRLLPLRMEALATQSESGNLVDPYLRGRHCLPSPSEAISNGRVSFAKGTVAQVAVKAVASQVGATEEALIKDVKFAVAVDAIIANCGEKAIEAIFFSRYPQTRKAIERIARTSDVRQRYHVDGVVDGRFRSIGPQGDDPVYDTVSFAEVTSRLGRAAGLLGKWSVTCRRFRKSECANVRDLNELCRTATTVLRDLISARSRASTRIPMAIERDSIEAAFAKLTASGQTVGKLKAVLKLIVKNVWDFDEMRRRGIKATPEQRGKALDSIEAILATTSTLKAKLEKK